MIPFTPFSQPLYGNPYGTSDTGQFGSIGTGGFGAEASHMMNMQMMQAQRMADMQMRVSQMQMDMMRSMERVQLSNLTQAPLPGLLSRSLGGFGGQPYFNRLSAPVPSQSFGGLLFDAGLGRVISNVTGGFLFPGYATQFGASRQTVTQRAEDELRQRLDDFIVGGARNIASFASFGISDFFLNRSQFAFQSERGTTARNIMNRFANVRSGLDPADMAAGGRGTRLFSNFTQGLTTDIQRSMVDLNRMRGFTLTREDYGNLEDAIFSSMTFEERERLVRSDRGGRAQQVEQRRNDIVELTRALGLNTAQAAELTRNMADMNISQKEISRMDRQANIGTMNLGITRYQETIARAQLMSQGRGMDLGVGRAFSDGQFSSAALMFNRLVSQGRKEELGRFGGTEMEAAQNYQNQMFQIGANMQQRTGVAVGLGGFMGESGTVGLAQTMARVYGRNPLAALTLQLDPNARVRSALLSPLAAYRQVMADAQRFGANSLLSRPEMLAKRFANMAGVSLERAAEMMETYRRSDQDFGDLAATLTKTGPRITSADITNFQQQAAAAGVALSADDLKKANPAELAQLIKRKDVTQSQYFDIATMPGGQAPDARLELIDAADPEKGLAIFQGFQSEGATRFLPEGIDFAQGPGVTFQKVVRGNNIKGVDFTGYDVTDPARQRAANLAAIQKRLNTNPLLAGITADDILLGTNEVTAEDASSRLRNLYESGRGLSADLLSRRVSAISEVFGDSKESTSAREDLIRRLSKISATSGESFNLNQMREMVMSGKGSLYAGFDTPEERRAAAAAINQFASTAVAHSAPEKVLINEFGRTAVEQLGKAFRGETK